MRSLTHLVASVFVALSVLNYCAHGVSITFTHEGTGSGYLESVGNFGPTAFVITAVVNTDNRVFFGDGWYLKHSFAEIYINGIGTFQFTTPTRTFVNNKYSIVGFSRALLAGEDLFNGPTAAPFASWDMTTGIGPITGTGTLFQWSVPQVWTTGGQIWFNDGESLTTFTAVIPAPGAGACLMLSIALTRRRRRCA